MGRFLIHMDAQDAQDFFRRRLACVPGHPQIRTRSLLESASPAAASRPDYPVHPVHRCSIYSPSRWICPVAGGGAPGSQANGSFPKGTGRLSEKSPAGYPPPHHRDATTRERGRPARMLSLRLPLSFPAKCCSRPPCRREPHGHGRSRGRAPLPVDSGGGDGRSCERICAGGTPALPGGLPPMTGSHQRAQKCRSILAPVVVEGGPSVLVPIRVPLVVPLH